MMLECFPLRRRANAQLQVSQHAILDQQGHYPPSTILSSPLHGTVDPIYNAVPVLDGCSCSITGPYG